MLPREYRLHSKKDIEHVLKVKRGVFDPICGVKLAPNNLGISRFAIVVGIKVSKSSVVRNRVRRQYREIVHDKLVKIAPGFDVMLLASKAAIDLPYEQKKERLLKVFKRAKLL